MDNDLEVKNVCQLEYLEAKTNDACEKPCDKCNWWINLKEAESLKNRRDEKLKKG